MHGTHLTVAILALFYLVNTINAEASQPIGLTRTKRINSEEEVSARQVHTRKKRIGSYDSSERPLIRTKRIDIKIREDSADKKDKRVSATPEKTVSPPDMQITNNIHELPKNLLGPCRGQKVNQTISLPNCKPLTVENMICGGLCEIELQPFNGQPKFYRQQSETCSFCGPREYEQKLLFLQCHSGTRIRRRWKFAVKQVHVIKSCGCIKSECFLQNKVSSEQSVSYF